MSISCGRVVRGEVLEFNVATFFFDDVKRAGCETDDVSWDRGFLLPFGSAFIVWQRAFGDELAVRDWR